MRKSRKQVSRAATLLLLGLRERDGFVSGLEELSDPIVV